MRYPHYRVWVTRVHKGDQWIIMLIGTPPLLKKCRKQGGVSYKVVSGTKIIYENTTFAKKFRACGALSPGHLKSVENKGVSYKRGVLINISTDSD